MKKKLLFTLVFAISVFFGMNVYAADNDITVSVDRRTIDFADQEPVVESERVLVPLRGVFEAMGAQVYWNQEKQQVTVFSYDNVNRLVLTLGSTEFKRITFKSLFDVETESFTSEVAPKAVNGRTMVPIYLIADYMYNDVEWIQNTHHVKFTSKRFLSVIDNTEGGEEALNRSLPCVSISSDADKISAGDTVSVKVVLSNTSALNNAQLFGSFVTLDYDNESFKFESAKVYSDGKEVFPETLAVNEQYKVNSVKLAYMFDTEMLYTPKDGDVIAECIFTVTDEKGGEFKLSDRYSSYGADTSVIYLGGDSVSILEKADALYIDTASVFVGK